MSELNVGNLNVGQYLNLPVYPESGLPAGVPVGHMVFNSTKGKIVVWNGLLWVAIGSKKYAMTATGSVTSADLSGEFSGYKVLKFTGNGSLNVTSSPDDSGIELLIIAGGGGGGGVIGGGGGAGGVIYKRSLYLPTGVYNITIGQGGDGGKGWNVNDQEGRAGTPTVFSGGDIFYEAIGGGGGCGHGGASPNATAGAGGSGGGGANLNRVGGGTIGLQCGRLAAQIKTDYPMTYSTPRHDNMDAYAKDINGNLLFSSVRDYQVGNETGGDPQHTTSRTTLHPGPHIIRHTQGHSGGSFGDGNLGAGGGGAGGFGQAAGPPRGVAGDGGIGAYFDIEGTKKAYAGGGGGGVRGTGRTRGIGGVGGGGNGGRDTLSNTPYESPTANAASNGQSNTGGGGGGGGYNGPTPGIVGGNGGPGVLIIRYKAN